MAGVSPSLPAQPVSAPAARSVSSSPLVEIEARVQARAKDLSLDLRTPADAATLRDLVDDEIERWSTDFQRGLRPFDLADPDVVADRVRRNLVGYGPLEPLLVDDDVWEVMVNAPDLVFPGQVLTLVEPPPRGWVP